MINPNGTPAPLSSNNKFYVGTSKNQLFLNLLNPYHHFSWSKSYIIEVEAPVFDVNLEDNYLNTGLTKEQYEYLTYYDVNMFTIGWGMPYKELLDSKDSIIYPMFMDLLAEAKRYIRYHWVLDELKYRKLVSLYIAHYLERFIETMKDIENDRSLNVRINDEGEHRKIVIGQKVMQGFDTTLAGREFLRAYDTIGRVNNILHGVIE